MADENKQQKVKTVAGLRVSAKAEGFRRGGRAWTVAPQEVPVSDFNKEQLAQLKSCPGMTVTEIEIEVPAE